MKFESMLLASLSFVCVAVCALVMVAMLTITPASVQLAAPAAVAPHTTASVN